MIPLERINDLLRVQGENGNWNYDSYMLGMYNGIELCVAIMEDRDPNFRSKPDTGWLADKKDT